MPEINQINEYPPNILAYHHVRRLRAYNEKLAFEYFYHCRSLELEDDVKPDFIVEDGPLA